MTAIDVTSSEPVLSYVPREGEELEDDEAAARALSGNAIGRLAYKRAFAEVTDRVGQPVDRKDPEQGVIARPDPRNPDPDVVNQVIDELVASGRYAPVEAKTKKAKAEAQEKAAEEVAERTTDEPPETANAAEKPEA